MSGHVRMCTCVCVDKQPQEIQAMPCDLFCIKRSTTGFNYSIVVKINGGPGGTTYMRACV